MKHKIKERHPDRLECLVVMLLFLLLASSAFAVLLGCASLSFAAGYEDLPLPSSSPSASSASNTHLEPSLEPSQRSRRSPREKELEMREHYLHIWANYKRRHYEDEDHLLWEARKVLHLMEARELSKSEAAFYFHKLHDFNADGVLDGLELLRATRHAFVHSGKFEAVRLTLEDFQELVDSELQETDTNNDGLVDIGELFGHIRDQSAMTRLEEDPSDVPESFK